MSSSDEEIRDMIITEFFGKVRKLMLNPDASWILDDIYRKVATKEQKAIMLREWYGPEFALFREAEGTTDLGEILEKEPNKRGPILKSLMELINPMIQKGWTAFTSLHDAMYQYFRTLRPGSEGHRSFMDLCLSEESGDLIKHLGFTDSGTRLASLLLAYGTAKDRRHMIKSFKDAFQMMSVDMFGHVVILAAYETIDDTRLISKSIIPQILTPESEDQKYDMVILAANDPHARTTLLYLFEGQSKALFPPSLSRDIAILSEVIEIRETTSKKDPEIRRKELVDAISPPLLEAIAQKPIDLVTTSFGCQFVANVLLSATAEKTTAINAVAHTASGDINDPVHLSYTPFTGRMYKTLVQGGRFDKQQGKIIPVLPSLDFADAIYPHIKGQEIGWATGPSSFVILSMLEATDFSKKQELKKTLGKHQKELKRAAMGELSGIKKKSEKQEENEGRKEKSEKQSIAVKQSGNVGTKLILEKVSSAEE